MPKNWSTIE
jgi:imidazolonepropionase